MPAQAREKCRQCSKLSLEQALAKHGSEGDGCWSGEPCHKRRTYYRHRERYNRSRRLKYTGDRESAAQIDLISLPHIPAVVVHFYRQRKDEPLHAVGVELWIGQQKKAVVQPVHTLGWTESQLKTYLKQALASFSCQHQVQITDIAATVELAPSLCPLVLCPLKPTSNEQTDIGT